MGQENTYFGIVDVVSNVEGEPGAKLVAIEANSLADFQTKALELATKYDGDMPALAMVAGRPSLVRIAPQVMIDVIERAADAPERGGKVAKVAKVKAKSAAAKTTPVKRSVKRATKRKATAEKREHTEANKRALLSEIDRLRKSGGSVGDLYRREGISGRTEHSWRATLSNGRNGADATA